MAHTSEMTEVEIADIKPYERNAKVHSVEQIKKIAESIRHFGFLSPCLLDKNKNLIAGHGRLEAAKKLGMKSVPCVYIEGLSEAKRKAYILADNKLADLGTWDQDLVNMELFDLCDAGVDMSLFGFDTEHFWQESKREGDDAYDEFVDKFNTPLTTDDCYTPQNVYETVKSWVLGKYHIGEEAEVIRPFYPGGDYQSAHYPAGSVVIDNPPFSILSQICKFYCEQGVRFFLFAPALTLFSAAGGSQNYLPLCVDVVYENGAVVATSFVTNMGPYKIDTAPDLFQLIKAANEENNTAQELLSYRYPDNVLTPSTISKWVKNGADIRIKASESQFIRSLDAQKEEGKSKAIYGGGFLISRAAAEKAAAEKAAAEKAAAEKAAAEKAAAEKEVIVWALSKREQAIVDRLE